MWLFARSTDNIMHIIYNAFYEKEKNLESTTKTKGIQIKCSFCYANMFFPVLDVQKSFDELETTSRVDGRAAYCFYFVT